MKLITTEIPILLSQLLVKKANKVECNECDECDECEDEFEEFEEFIGESFTIYHSQAKMTLEVCEPYVYDTHLIKL